MVCETQTMNKTNIEETQNFASLFYCHPDVNDNPSFIRIV